MRLGLISNNAILGGSGGWDGVDRVDGLDELDEEGELTVTVIDDVTVPALLLAVNA
jgi:hypothetical protein